MISQFHADLIAKIEPHQKKRNLETIISFIVQLVRLQPKRYPLISSEKQIRITNRSGPGKWPREPVILSAKLHSGDRETESRERGSALCVSLHAGNSTRNSASKNREMERGCNRGSRTKRPQLFVSFFPPPTFPPLSECESGSNPRDASSPSPPSFKCAFFLFSFFFYVDKAENGNRGPLSPTTLDEICCFVDVANNRRKKFFSGASFIPTD